MAAGKKNGGVETVRIQFTLPAALVSAIDDYCAQTCMLRSTYVEYTLASSLSTAKQLVDGVGDSLPDLLTGIVKSAGE